MLFIIAKILIKKTSKIRKSFFAPWIGIAIGTLMLLVIDMIMDGMRNEIFKSLNLFEYGYKIEKVNNLDEVLILLDKHEVQYKLCYNREVLVSDENSYHISKLKMRAESEKNRLIVGEGLAHKLNLEIGDSLSILSPLDVSLSTSKVPHFKMRIDSIFSIPVLDYDLNNIFIESSLDQASMQFEKAAYITSELSKHVEDLIYKSFEDVKLSYWESEYESLIAAINLEKKMYLGFAYIFVLISSLGLFSMLNFVLINKLKAFSIIHSLGISLISIRICLLSVLSIASIISSLFGFALAYCAMNWNLLDIMISRLFPSDLFYHFTLKIDIYYFLFIATINLFVVLFSSALPISEIKRSKVLTMKRES